MIGIVLWALLIIFIVICACPGFFVSFFGSNLGKNFQFGKDFGYVI